MTGKRAMTGKAGSAAANHLVAIDDEPELLATSTAHAAESDWVQSRMRRPIPRSFKATIRRSVAQCRRDGSADPGLRRRSSCLRFLYEEQCQAHVVLDQRGRSARCSRIAKGVGDQARPEDGGAGAQADTCRRACARARADFIAAPLEIDAAMIREALRSATSWRSIISRWSTLSDQHVDRLGSTRALASSRVLGPGHARPVHSRSPKTAKASSTSLTDRVFELGSPTRLRSRRHGSARMAWRPLSRSTSPRRICWIPAICRTGWSSAYARQHHVSARSACGWSRPRPWR